MKRIPRPRLYAPKHPLLENTTRGALDVDWTRDLSLTKGVLYHWATRATFHKQTKDGAGEGNRTLVLSLEGFGSTIELHPHSLDLHLHQTFGGEGWIRTSVLVRGQIYSLLPLTTRPPLRRNPELCRKLPDKSTGKFQMDKKQSESARHYTPEINQKVTCNCRNRLMSSSSDKNTTIHWFTDGRGDDNGFRDSADLSSEEPDDGRQQAVEQHADVS